MYTIEHDRQQANHRTLEIDPEYAEFLRSENGGFASTGMADEQPDEAPIPANVRQAMDDAIDTLLAENAELSRKVDDRMTITEVADALAATFPNRVFMLHSFTVLGVNTSAVTEDHRYVIEETLKGRRWQATSWRAAANACLRDRSPAPAEMAA